MNVTSFIETLSGIHGADKLSLLSTAAAWTRLSRPDTCIVKLPKNISNKHFEQHMH